MNSQELVKALDEMVDLTLQACKLDTSTKDGYGTMMVVLDKFKSSPVVQKNYVLLCIARGYPRDTGESVIRIMRL